MLAKKCFKCGETKQAEEFHKNVNTKDGLQVWCKACSAAYHAANREEILAKRAAYRAANRDMINARNVSSLRRRRTGMTEEIYNGLLAKQSNRCAICGKHQSELKVALNADHCHHTGTVRGLLCNNCNRGIGYLRDDPAMLETAAEYLRMYRDGGSDVD